LTKLLITRPLPQNVLSALDDFDLTVRQETSPLNADELRSALRDYDAVLPTLGDVFSADVFVDVPNPRARILANFGVGYNHIDAAAAKAAGLTVTNTPGAVTDATADIAMTLMLMSARRAGEGERMVRAGAWEGWHPTQMLGMHLSGKTVGIVGMGRIGQAIARRCHFGFGMTVKYFSRSEKSLEFPAEVSADLADLAGSVDVLVAAVPGSAQTHHLIDADVLGAMRPHAHLINISRGDVVEEAALITALQAQEIGGAGLDVYEFEPKVPPGTSALEVRIEMGLMAVENLKVFFAGKTPPNAV